MNSPHPLVLILAALWFSTLAILIADPLWLSALMLLCLLFRGLLVGFEFKLWVRQILKFLPLIIFIILLQAYLSDPQSSGGHSHLFVISRSGVQTGLAVSLRLLIVFFSAQVLVRLNYEDFDLAFRALRLPEELCFMVFYVIHLIPLAAEKIRHSLRLLRLRGIAWNKLRWKAKLKLYQRISLTVIAGLLSGSDIQATALELRGFRSSGPRSRLHTRAFGISDAALVLVLAVVTHLIVITL